MRKLTERVTETEIEQSDPYGCQTDAELEEIEEEQAYTRHLEGDCEDGCWWCLEDDSGAYEFGDPKHPSWWRR